MSILKFYGPQVQQFCDTIHEWKRDHDEAMACRDLEQALSLGISLYDLLTTADESARLAEATGVADYTTEMVDAFDLLFDRWLEPCECIRSQIEDFEKSGFTVERSAEFIKCVDATLASREGD